MDRLKYCPVTEGRVTLTKPPFSFQSDVIFTNTCEFPKYVDSYTGFMWSHPHLQHVGRYLQGKVSGKVIVWIIKELGCPHPLPLSLSSIFLGGMWAGILHPWEGRNGRTKDQDERLGTVASSLQCLLLDFLFPEKVKLLAVFFVKLNCVDRSMNECWSLGCVCRSHWNLGSDRADLTWEDFT